MIQWHSNDDVGNEWEHRGYWGDLLVWGTVGTNARRYQGGLPATGTWVQLVVAASQVGIVVMRLDGIAYSLFGGRATWDYSARRSVGTFEVEASETIGSLAGSGAIALAAGALTVGGSASITFSGTSSGNGAFTLGGSGTLTWSGNASHI